MMRTLYYLKSGTLDTLGHLADSTLDMSTVGPEQPRVLKPFNGFSIVIFKQLNSHAFPGFHAWPGE